MQKLPGLYFIQGTQWAIDKRVKGVGRIRKRYEASTREDAERLYFEIIREAIADAQKPAFRTFRCAATKYLAESTLKSIARDVQALNQLDTYIGHLPLDRIHMGTLRSYLDDRRASGIRSGTIRRDLATVRRILELASRVWRDDDDKPWLASAPMLTPPDWQDKKENYPLDWDEQIKLFQELPNYLATMALFAVNTGAREQVICGLRWDWECPIPELNTSVFITPGLPKDYPNYPWKGEKNKRDGLYVLNSIARSIIDSQRGKSPSFVFPFTDIPIAKMQTSGWKRAWIRAGLPDDPNLRKGPHNLRHTFGRRLRNAGVPFETRKVLFNHVDDDVTSNYSPAEIEELINAVERVTTAKGTLIRRRF